MGKEKKLKEEEKRTRGNCGLLSVMDLFEINSVNLGRGEMAAPGTDLMLQQLLQTD